VAAFSPGSILSEAAASVDPASCVLFTVFVFFRCSLSQGHGFFGCLDDVLVVAVGQIEEDVSCLSRTDAGHGGAMGGEQ
jgi:hypothetical protein